MMNNVDHTRICPVCGKLHWPCDLDNYAFRKIVKTKNGSETLYFCKWSCLRKWEKDQEKPPKREFALKTGEEHCADCRYCIRGKYGFIDCTIYSQGTRPEKKACRRFMPRYDDQKEVL